MATLLADLRASAYRMLAAIRRLWLRSVWGMDIGKGVRISSKAALDYTFPQGVHIGDYTMITPGVRIFTHDFVGAHHDDTHIGKCCFIGANSVITAGVRIGDHCIIAAGSVVNKHVPAHSLAGGNPVKLLKAGITTGHYGRTVDWAPGRAGPPADSATTNETTHSKA